MTSCEVAVTQDGTNVCLALSGEIDLTNRDRVGEEVNDAISNETEAVVLDTSSVTYLDSSGLRFLFGLAERLNRIQVALTIVAPPSSIARKVIDLAGLDQVAEVSNG